MTGGGLTETHKPPGAGDAPLLHHSVEDGQQVEIEHAPIHIEHVPVMRMHFHYAIKGPISRKLKVVPDDAVGGGK